MNGSKNSNCDSCSTGFDFFKKILVALICVFIVYGVIYIDTLINFKSREYNYIGKADRMERTVIVNGFGKATGRNDIAVTTIGYSNVDKDVAVAQANNSKVMDQVKSELKKMGIEEKDLTDNYTIYPEYDYTQAKGQELKGYRVSNSVAVKIRDLSKIPAVLSLAGKYGATEVGGLSFTIDDPENLKSEARERALQDAQIKVKKLAQDLGVRIVGVVSFSEYSNADYPEPYYDVRGEGLGGGSGPATISSGSQDVSVSVTVTYEILP